jgi:hypothetical protein
MRFESQHEAYSFLNEKMILFYDIIEIFHFPAELTWTNTGTTGSSAFAVAEWIEAVSTDNSSVDICKEV